jgi:hypothetical protein
MPHIANMLSQDTNSPAANMPAGTSQANTELQERALRSFVGFYYSNSEVLPGFSPPTVVDIKRLARDTLRNTITKIYNLLNWSEGWNGYDACIPDYEAIIYADQWLVQMFLEAIALDSTWIEPNVTASEEGEVVFEWWYGVRKLTVYIGNQSAEYVKVWGTDINSDMSDGDASPISTCRSLWEWLTC